MQTKERLERRRGGKMPLTKITHTVCVAGCHPREGQSTKGQLKRRGCKACTGGGCQVK